MAVSSLTFNLLLHFTDSFSLFPWTPHGISTCNCCIVTKRNGSWRICVTMYAINVQLLIFTILHRHRNDVLPHFTTPPRESVLSASCFESSEPVRVITHCSWSPFLTQHLFILHLLLSRAHLAYWHITCKKSCEDPNAQKGNISRIMTPEGCFCKSKMQKGAGWCF